MAIIPALLLFVGLACSGPISNEDTDTLVIDENFFPDTLAIYTSQNDIVDIFVPLNSLNFEADENPDSNGTDEIILFFVEEDLASGEDKGLFIRKGTEITKLLNTGRDIAATNGNDKKVYFAASDGIYVYNAKDNKAEKYGTVTDDLINIAIDNTSDVIYILTKNKELFKVTDDGEKQVKISDVSNAEQIVMDYENNLYFRTTDKDVYAINEGGVKKLEGLPENSNKLTLLRPPFVIDGGVPLVVDDKAFIIYANGTVEKTEFQIKAKPTAFSMEGTLIHYYAYKKKIYEYNILTILFSEVFNQLGDYLNAKKDDIQTISTRPRSSFRQ